jgi:hypothetical protein
VKAVTFDFEQLRRDVKRRLSKEGNGAVHRLSAHTGVSEKVIRRITSGEAVRDIESVLSVMAHFGLQLRDYTRHNPALPPAGIDWALFRECVEFLCGGNARELAHKVDIRPETATALLQGRPCRPNVFLQLCLAMHVKPEKFGLGWRDEWKLSLRGKARVDAGGAAWQN